jgi:Stress responsive A/B Barrel Domain
MSGVIHQRRSFRMALQHVVLIGFKDHVTEMEAKEVARRFGALRRTVPGVASFEWGSNNSPEDLNRGLTHAFVLGFADEKARDGYLVHPVHVAFADWVKPFIGAITIVDYLREEALP